MSANKRPVVAAKRNPMRPPQRPIVSRALSAAPVLNGRASPADSMVSAASLSRTRSPVQPANLPLTGLKRKDRDFDPLPGEETNINVVVRCRGRNDRELKENSGVVVSADGLKGNTVELSMGPNAVSNKSYHFDRVFSPAADQAVLFDEVVAPILDDVLCGFNCTIFAYGQTGTGKTYTMSGDITDILPVPDAAGIIPRVLHTLFTKLDSRDAESAVKCSFIELYNEDLRDLLALDETAKLKIFDDASRKSHTATMVQGMEETHIKNASGGIDLLRKGSHKRHVAATKCNDLSSRSHTVFTITTYVKRPAQDGGDDFVASGKLNLVDLAGSENIGRSGAENKRATEAGLINKSLLTLGRVINALVDKSSHIPYRESKLTRLLQDSLGGRTKTCIIATLSPAKSNLEETISTLDYAFRAKNIRNKPQLNALQSKKTLFREFTSEIEKLKAELIATRHRNGVYLTSENFEDLTTESESRRILSEEQKDKIESMESNLHKKAQELFALTNSLSSIKKDGETIQSALNSTKGVLQETELVLQHTRQNLAEEAMLLQAHQATEEKLFNVGQGLISTLGQTTSDVGAWRSKSKRKSDLQTLNRTNWSSSQHLVSDTTQLVEHRMSDFQSQQEQMISNLSSRMQSFVKDEMFHLQQSTLFLDGQNAKFAASEAEVNLQTSKARDDMTGVLEGIQTLRDDVKQKVGEGLDGLSAAAQRISAGVVSELEVFHTQMHASYSSLGKDFKATFDDLLKNFKSQQEEADELRSKLSESGNALMQANAKSEKRLQAVIESEKVRGLEDRTNLISQMKSLVQQFGETQEKRLDSKMHEVKVDLAQSNETFGESQQSFNSSMDAWVARGEELNTDIVKSREKVKSKIKLDWTAANEQNASIQATTRSVHEETVRIVDAQMKHMDVQLQALDQIVSRIREQNGQQHDSHVASISKLGSTVNESYSNIAAHLSQSSTRTGDFSHDVNVYKAAHSASLSSLEQEVRMPLANLRSDVLASGLNEYEPTGQTPMHLNYSYITDLPRTDAHEALLDRFRNPRNLALDIDGNELEDLTETVIIPSPSKSHVFNDSEGQQTRSLSPELMRMPSRPESSASNGGGSLRELSVNVIDASKSSKETKQQTTNKQAPGILASTTDANGKERELSSSIGPGTKRPRKAMAEGRENVPLSASVGAAGGRGLRNRERND